MATQRGRQCDVGSFRPYTVVLGVASPIQRSVAESQRVVIVTAMRGAVALGRSRRLPCHQEVTSQVDSLNNRNVAMMASHTIFDTPEWRSFMEGGVS